MKQMKGNFGPHDALVREVVDFVESGGVLQKPFRPSARLPFPTHIVHSLDDVGRFRSAEHPKAEIGGAWEWGDIRWANYRNFQEASDNIAGWWDGPQNVIHETSLLFGEILFEQLAGVLSQDEALEIADELGFVMMDRSVFGPNDLMHERLWQYYLAGGYPCGWRGAYPEGQLVVFSR